jgi:hypothetical protein
VGGIQTILPPLLGPNYTVRAVRRAGRELVRERFLPREDAEAFVKAAETRDVLVGEVKGNGDTRRYLGR